MGPLTLWWLAASSPRRFFAELEPLTARIPRAGRIAFLSLLTFSLVFTLGVARATGSDAWLPLVFAAFLGALAGFLYLWGFGSIFVQRPGALALRAWEVSGWSWTPAFFTGLSMIAPMLILPTVALPVMVLGVVVWHIAVLRAGLGVFLERSPIRTVTLYTLYIFILPLVLLGVVVWLTASLLG